MKKYLFAMLLLTACNSKSPEPYKYAGYETDDTNYVKGQILLPDLIHDDTLIVVNADSLNWCMVNYDASNDGDLRDILNAYCEPKLKK